MKNAFIRILQKHILVTFVVIIFQLNSYAQTSVINEDFVAKPENKSPITQINSFNTGSNYQDKIITKKEDLLFTSKSNDTWYVFSVISNGKLNFRLQPNNINDNYYWTIYKLSDINNYPGTQISSNSTKTADNKDLAIPPNSNNSIYKNNYNLISAINVSFGETYVVNIRNNSTSASNYKLDLSESTASLRLADNPYIQSINSTAISFCSTNFSFDFSKNVQCNSVTTCDFSLSGPGGPYTISNISGSGCSTGTLSKSFTITFSPPITQSGSYTLSLLNTCGSVADSLGNVAWPSNHIFNVFAPGVTVNPSSVTICSANCVTLTASGCTSYIWSMGGTDSIQTVCPNITSTYSVTATKASCTSTTSVTVNVNPNITPTFTQLGPYCQGATPGILPLTSTNGITGTWLPATISTSTTGSTTYSFTPTSGQCAIITTMTIIVNPNITPTFTQLGPYCQGATPGVLPLTSTNGITGTWSPALVSTATTGSTTYTFTPTAGQCALPTTMLITVNPNITPTFTQLGPYCQGATPDVLPPISTNTPAITGTWTPSTISTATLGTSVYTFIPTTGQCAIPATMSIIVNPNITPIFTQLGPYCQGATPGMLPANSTNIPPITGTWSPPTISTATPGTTVYTFTPNTNQCALPTTMSITINPNITPTFTQLGPYCQGATPGMLPANSTNIPPITGTWSPPTINTATPGTTVYTFTPDTGQCAIITTMSITVNANIIPTFTQLGPYCQGATPDILPASSTNIPPITGTWSPSTISTANSGTSVYTFIPDTGQCALPTTMTIIVNPNITPTFTQLGPYCQGATPDILPPISIDIPPITGSWSPSTISTSTIGTAVYTFTPAAGQCASPTTMTIAVNPNITPTFLQIGPYCQGATPGILPASSTNVPPITGTWTPSTINTSTPGTTQYTFTPTIGQCALPATMTINVNANITPTFTQLGPFCQGTTPGILPSSSTDSPAITGTWAPSTISTATPGTTVYTFTPDTGQCAIITTMSITVNAPVIPTFTQLGPYCQGATPGILPASSNDVPPITGTWSPATISTAVIDTIIFTFIPTSGQCALPSTMNIVINPYITTTFTQLGPYCQGEVPDSLPSTSSNGISGTWSPPVITTSTAGSTNYIFTPDSSQCAFTDTMTIVVNAPITPTFAQVPAICAGDSLNPLPTTSQNGITGAWSPALDSITTTTYTFTPTAGICATTTTMTIIVNPTPTVNVPGSINACVSDTIPSIVFSSSTPGTTFSWINSDTTIGLAASGTDSVPAFTATNTGTNVVIATITVTPSTTSCPGIPSTFTITVNPISTVIVPGNIIVCPGDSVPMAVFTSSVSGATFFWNNSDTTIGLSASGTDSVPAFIATNNGTMPVTATITVIPSINNCSGIPSSYTITVNPAPTSIFTATSPICDSSNSIVQYTGTGDTTATFIWDFGGGAATPLGGFENYSVSWPALGFYNITLIVSANGCSSDTTLQTVAVSNFNINATTTNNTSCFGSTEGSATVTAWNGLGNFTYQWSTIPPQNTPNATNLAAGTYFVTVTDSSSCSKTDTITISQPPILSADTVVTPVTCNNGNNGSIIVTAQGGNGIYSYSLNGGIMQSSNIFPNLSPGLYDIVVSDYKGCTDTISDIVINNPDSITADFTIYSNTNCHGTGGGSVEVIPTGGTPPYSYIWSTTNADTTARIEDLKNQTYYVTVTDSNACSNKFSVEINKDPDIDPVFYTSFTPNGDGKNDVWFIDNLDLYPDNELVIVNRWGNEVYSIKGYKNDWDGDKLNEGTYFYVLKVTMCYEDKTFKGYLTILR